MHAPSSSARSLSVVVAAWNEPALLRHCLRSLDVALAQSGGEVIVACPAERGFEQLLAAEFGDAVGVTVGGQPTVPQLRKAGLARATGDIVAFLEDHASVAPEWALALRAEYDAFGDGSVAVGGPVAQGEGRSRRDWGAYLFDYGRFMPPHPGGRVRELSGLNMSFTRSLLKELDDVFIDGIFEGPLHEALALRQVPLWMAPSAVVFQNKAYPLRQTLAHVYDLGRGYAGRRLDGTRQAARAARAAACLILPFVLLWRVLSVVLSKRRDVRHVLFSLGFLSLITLSWSIGEFVGYVAGAGDSDLRWR